MAALKPNRNATCFWHTGPYRRQCCCHPRSDAQTVTCMPTFAVIGAQKSGSTALFGYFLMHPQFTPPKKKECHFFDKALRVDKPRPAKQAKNASDEGVEAVSTVKPPARAERLQYITPGQLMKYTNSFEVVPANKTGVKLTGDATPAYILSHKAPAVIKRLLPEIRLLLILRNPVDRAYSEWQMKHRRVTAQIFPENQTDIVILADIIMTCLKVAPKPTDPPSGTRALESTISSLTKCVIATAKKRDEVKIHWLGYHSRQVVQLTKCLRDWVKRFPLPRSDLIPRVARCTGKVSHETVEPFPDAVGTEMQHIQDECMEPSGDSAARYDAHKFRWDTCYPQGSSSNIVKDFVVRGLYLEQIKDYHAHFPPEQLMIISDKELRADPQRVLNTVFQFVGLAPLAFESTPNSAELNALIESQWPGFESSSGWHLASK
jgi:hypothetical protein